MVLSTKISLNGQSLDFSFKNIENISGMITCYIDLKTIEPRNGKRKPI